MSFKVINTPQIRVDSIPKVTGKEKYAADYSFPGMLYGKVLRAKHPHARIKSIDIQEARKLEGVHAVLTAQDIPGSKKIGAVIEDQDVLSWEKVRFLGDGIALVAADSPEIAEKALELIHVEYEPLPGVFDLLEALKPGAPLVHPERGDNIVVHHKVRKGDVQEGFASSDLIIEREYRTQFVEHSYIEPEACIAIPSPDLNGVQVLGSIQNPFSTRKMVARALNLELNRVQITQTTLGGSFGGKDEVMYIMASRAALLALKTGRPVKMVNSREESFIESYKRHPYVMRYKAGVSREGRIKAMEIYIVADSGAYASQSPFVTWRSTVQATGPYEIPHVKTDVLAVYTNNTYTGAMRGFGSPQVVFAAESFMDEIAWELKLDPAELRRRNIFRQGSITATGQRLDGHTVSLEEVMDKALSRIGYPGKEMEESDGPLKKGIGFAISFRGCSLGAEGLDYANAIVSAQADGSLYISTGVSDNGGGLKTVLSQIASEELGVPISKITVNVVDTAFVPDGGPAVASRSTIMGGNATRNAAIALRERFKEALSSLWDVPAQEIGVGEGRFFSLKDPKLTLEFSRVVEEALRRGIAPSAFGTYVAPQVSWDEELGQGDAYFTYVYACQAAEVEVDLETGKVKVIRVSAAHDLGKAINLKTAEGQIFGGVAMGLGYGLLEEVEIQNGHTRTTNFDTYLLPTSCDVPQIDPIIVENPDPYGPYGAKSLGEPTNELLAAAIANAVFRACGRRIRELPLTPERVLLGRSLKEKRGARGSEIKQEFPPP
ncbi:MAG: xanthine dehydrogenase family protein molybdopterin-binding subunit [Caldiserica bacterium]|jgi:CO/xanthine dehydrogenase Mo-binding subunit|nr:xanthine dehydrogenase family protein molybdopterin-binding subunit [Caldisericota bacterium]MDH7562579.1 xanthine dehydrogenase family protein molybdopterin-binding subunit [Caldisericota bacterium]